MFTCELPKRAALKLAAFFVATILSMQAISQTVSLNFREADIRAVIESAAEITGRSFVLDPRVKGNITIIAPGEIDADMFYEAILSALQVQGFQAVDDGAVTRVVPISQSFQIPAGLVGGELQTRVISLNHVTAADLVPVLRPMLTKGSLLQAYAAGNNLVVTDTAAQIRQIENILRDIDRADQSTVDIISLNHISAAEALHIAGQMQQFQQQQLSIVEDSFNNRVIVSGSRPYRAGFRKFVKELDVPTTSTQQGGVEVIYLDYAAAEEIQPILEGMLQSETFLQLAGETSAPDGSGTDSGGNFSIQADTDNNAIVIAASASVIGQIKNVIRKLDRRRPQVLIEAIVASVSEDVAREISTEISTFTRDTGGLVASFDGVLNQLIGVIADDALSDGDSAIGIGTAVAGIPPGITGAFGDFDSDTGEGWALLINALASDSETDILSTPSVLTLDNEEATLSVGQEVPFVTGSFTSATTDGGANPFQTIEREEVGVVLTVTPQINDGDSVRMQISQEISSISTVPVAGVSDIVTDQSNISTNVIVEDGNLLILGGLIQDESSNVQSRVPILGSIPLIGWLFRDDAKSTGKTVLMMFVRPTIVREPEKASEVSREKFDYLKQYRINGLDGRGVEVSEDILDIFEPGEAPEAVDTETEEDAQEQPEEEQTQSEEETQSEGQTQAEEQIEEAQEQAIDQAQLEDQDLEDPDETANL